MPVDLQIIRAHEFVRMGARGRFDVAASREVLCQLADACRKRGMDRALLDLRELHPGPKPVFTPDDIASLVSAFREMGFTKEQRLAVLYSADPHHRARLFALISRLRGWHVCAFDGFEEALVWLSEPCEPAESASAEVSVPVKARAQSVGISKPKIRPRH